LKQLADVQWLSSPAGQEFLKTQPPEAQKAYAQYIKTGGVAKVDPTALGWSPDAVDAAAETFNQTGVAPHYLGARQYGPMIMGAIQSRAMELLKEKYPELKDDPKGLIEKRTQQWQDYHTEQVAQNRFLSGPQSNTIRSLNVVVQHLQVLKQLKEAADSFDNNTFNRIAYWWSSEFGAPTPTNLDMAAVIVGNELIKAIQGGNLGTGEERAGAEGFFAKFKSGDQVEGAVDVGTKLLVGQLRAMKYGYLVATHRPESEFTRLLMPETRAYFSKAEIDAMKPDNTGEYTGIPGYTRGGAMPLKPDDIQVLPR
jgi:hypothetical protein